VTDALVTADAVATAPGSGRARSLVGTSVVEQLLEGRVVEDRKNRS
jgi:hypothetical protein